MESGKLIVIYGINNLGKSTQAKLLVDRIRSEGKDVVYLKYPLYDLEPSGPLLNTYLRKGNPEGMSVREFQLLQVLNRTQYDSELRKQLQSGTWIVAEDYIGTGIAWGMGGGVRRDFLEKMNAHLLREDLGILFQGTRFLEAREAGHQHETDDELMEKVRTAHEALAVAYGWRTINANKSIDEIADDVWKLVQEQFSL